MTENNFLVLRTSKIRRDSDGLVCLNDIHRAAGFSTKQLPSDWVRLPQAQNAIAAVIKRITGKSRDWTKTDIKSAYYTKRGQDAGTWADENVALAFAGYLSPDLAAEIRDVFLRYKKGDEGLVAEVRANKAKMAAAEHARHREVGKAIRVGYTDTLKAHGIDKPFDFANCTNEVYKPVLGGTAAQLRKLRGLKKGANLRDSMSTRELAYTMAAEALASERIEGANADGYVECRDETKFAATAIGGAITSDRANRQTKLV